MPAGFAFSCARNTETFMPLGHPLKILTIGLGILHLKVISGMIN